VVRKGLHHGAGGPPGRGDGGSHRGPNVVGLTGRTSFEQRLKPFRRNAQGRRDLTGCPPGAVDLLGLAGEAEGAEEAAEGCQEGHVPERKRRDEPSQRGQGGEPDAEGTKKTEVSPVLSPCLCGGRFGIYILKV